MHQGSILIVEDDSTLRHTLTSTLQAFGFEVVGASTGELALAELRNRHIEAVLLDLNMPGMGGMAACAKIRDMHLKLPILVLKARDRDEDKVAALDAGADDYVTKPFRLPELSARIRAAVRRTRPPEDNQMRTLEIGEVRLDPVATR